MSEKILIAILAFNGVEETELTVTRDMLARVGITCTVLSVSDSLQVKDSHGYAFTTDQLLSKASLDVFDGLFIPGGPGIFDIQNDPTIIKAVRYFFQKNKWIGAICAAPLVLKNAGCLPLNYTAHDCVAQTLGKVSKRAVEVDGKIITSRGPGTVFPFVFTWIKHLTNRETLLQLIKGIHCEIESDAGIKSLLEPPSNHEKRNHDQKQAHKSLKEQKN